MGKKRIIAETGAGQHGVATATACALFGLQCIVYMGEVDVERQKLNVLRMKILGAEVVPVKSGSRTLKDAVNEALRDWVTNVSTTHYLIGSAVGPDPFPRIVKYFQSVIGNEARAQMLKESPFEDLPTPGRLPDVVVACVGGGSNAIGAFGAFLGDPSVRLVGVEGGGSLKRELCLSSPNAVNIGENSGESQQKQISEEPRISKSPSKMQLKSIWTKFLTCGVEDESQKQERELSETSTHCNRSIAKHCATLSTGTCDFDHKLLLYFIFRLGSPGVFHGMQTYLLQNKEGQIIETSSISAGLDYPGLLDEIGKIVACQTIGTTKQRTSSYYTFNA